VAITPPPGYHLHGDLFGDFDMPTWRFLVLGNLLALIPLLALALILWLPYQFYVALGAPLALPDPGWPQAVVWGIGLLIIVGSAFAHELLHALALRLLGYHPRLSFSGGFLFASIRPGEFLTRRHYLIMILTPLLVLTIGGGLLLLFLPPPVGQAVLIALLLNGAASIGDLMVALRARRQPSDALFASDDAGIKVYMPI
jgi:hypothetical protein